MSFSNPTHIAVISLWAEDVPAAVHFYRDIIGLQLLHNAHHKEPYFDVGGTYLTILKGKPIPAQDAEPSHFPLIALTVDDLDSAVEHLRAHQVTLPWDVFEGTGSRWIKFYDSAGNLIELVQFT